MRFFDVPYAGGGWVSVPRDEFLMRVCGHRPPEELLDAIAQYVEQSELDRIATRLEKRAGVDDPRNWIVELYKLLGPEEFWKLARS